MFVLVGVLVGGIDVLVGGIGVFVGVKDGVGELVKVGVGVRVGVLVGGIFVRVGVRDGVGVRVLETRTPGRYNCCPGKSMVLLKQLAVSKASTVVLK